MSQREVSFDLICHGMSLVMAWLVTGGLAGIQLS